MQRYTKTVTYSLTHLCVAVIVAFALTGSWKVALTIGIIEPLVQTVAYHLHERFWENAKMQNMPAGMAPSAPPA